MPEQEIKAESGVQGGQQVSTWDNFNEQISGDGQPAVQDQQFPGESTGDIKTADPEQLAAEQVGQDQQTIAEAPATGQKPEAQYTREQFETIQAELAEAKKYKEVAEFYQGLYNEKYLSEQQVQQPAKHPQQPVPPQAPIPPGQLPEGVLPPEEWTKPQDIVPFFEHKFQQQMQQQLKNVYQAALRPMMQKMAENMRSLEDMVVRANFKDFADVVEGNQEKGVKGIIHELFTIDPAGKIIGAKDPAAIERIRNSPMPLKALYDYAISKKAPQMIQQAKRTATEELLQEIDRKPKINLPASSSVSTPGAKLDWDTPSEEAERILHSTGHI